LSHPRHAVQRLGLLTMTGPSSRVGASSVLGHVLVLVAVLVSSLCVAGQSVAAASVRAEPVSATAEPASAIAEPASVTADVRPAVGPYASPAAAEPDSARSGEAVGHQQVADSPSPASGGSGGQAAVATVSAHEGPRLYPPLPSPVGDRHGTPGPPAGTASLAVGSEAAPPAPHLVQ